LTHYVNLMATSDTNSEPSASSHPQIGMLATVRNRRAIVAYVEPFDTPKGRFHVVKLEYTDLEGVAQETLVWEIEHGRKLLPPHALPRVGEEAPMPAADFDALVRSARWSALAPFLSPDTPAERATTRIAAPFFGAVEADDFQLVPLIKALRMPRVSLLLADDVGLGKTVEAGLVLTELLLRRRIRRVLILSPASLRQQWKQEMRDKFALDFDIVDRSETHALRKRLGLDANPWRVFPRVIASYHYLRQDDIREEFLSTCRTADRAELQEAQLPWDLLIVDEAHNIMPGPFGEDSALVRTVRAISPYFEHKLFLTATPHNGHTRSFSGLLELLDPVRFTRTSEFRPEEKERVKEVVVRRLKREINDLDDRLNRPRRFADRLPPRPLPLFFHPTEKRLSAAVEAFRTKVKSLVASSSRTEQVAGSFAVEVLNKRLLSCPSTFADSWFRFKAGAMAPDEVRAVEVDAARRLTEEDIEDDREKESRALYAAHTVGAWLKPLLPELKDEISAVDQALNDLGIHPTGDGSRSLPKHDARLDRAVQLVEEHLYRNKKWRNDERLIIFTEFKTTLDYVAGRLKQLCNDDGTRIRILYGGGDLDQTMRDEVKRAFNDPADPVRLLIATDVASEGLNLQETARLVLHWDVPWNPARLEQRNGRLDRHGQARDVIVHHFTSEDDADLRFMAHVVAKVDEIREDLGSVGEIFDAAFQRRFLEFADTETVIGGLDHDVAVTRNRAAVPREDFEHAVEEARKIAALGSDLDLSPDTLRDTLEVALGIGIGHPRLEGPDARGRMQLARPLPPRWEPLIDDTLRLADRGGALPGLIFDPRLFLEMVENRPVFRPAKDTVLLHLGHPVFRQALAMLARSRFPGGDEHFFASRWIARRGAVPRGVDALLCITVEELAVNELREPFHHWIRTWRVPVAGGRLLEPLPYVTPAADHAVPISDPQDSGATLLWDEVQLDVSGFIRDLATGLTSDLERQMKVAFEEEQKAQTDRFRHRIKEIERLRNETNIAKLEKEIEEIELANRQLMLLPEAQKAQEAHLRGKQEELERRLVHYKELLTVLEHERERVLKHLLPARYRLRGSAQVFPVAVEIRLPEVSQ